jgi:hypothetical protein
MTFVVDERGLLFDRDAISRVHPDEYGRSVIRGYVWPWIWLDAAVCDRVVGPYPAATTTNASAVHHGQDLAESITIDIWRSRRRGFVPVLTYSDGSCSPNRAFVCG